VNSATFRLTPLTTPPPVPGSSPEVFLYFAPLTIGMHPSSVTLVGPSDVSRACPMFAYGIGFIPSPLGVRHTSGNTVLLPPLSV